MSTFDFAVSLGPNCQAKFQLVRNFGKERCPSGVFDWQTTGRRALRAYLRNHFAGMFELDDLEIGPYGIVRNRRYGTAHPHEFPEGIAAAELPFHYSTARSRHDHLTGKMHALFSGDARLLLCLSRPLSINHLARIWWTIHKSYPRLRFRLLNGPNGDRPASDHAWSGNNAIWEAHLWRFRNGRVHQGPHTR